MDQHLSIEETGIQGLYVVNPVSYKSDEDLIEKEDIDINEDRIDKNKIK